MPEQLECFSQRITATLLEEIKKKDDIRVILLYNSLPDEVNTHSLIKELHDKGIKVLLPTIVGEELELHEYVSASEMTLSSSFNIQESKGPLFDDYSKIDLAIIPGMGFTADGKRLGRGKGFYDRLLPHLQCPLYGLAFPFQIFSDIPTESHDVKMDYVIS